MNEKQNETDEIPDLSTEQWAKVIGATPVRRGLQKLDERQQTQRAEGSDPRTAIAAPSHAISAFGVNASIDSVQPTEE